MEVDSRVVTVDDKYVSQRTFIIFLFTIHAIFIFHAKMTPRWFANTFAIDFVDYLPGLYLGSAGGFLLNSYDCISINYDNVKLMNHRKMSAATSAMAINVSYVMEFLAWWFLLKNQL